MTNLKTSVLINKQVPEFVREEYPLFISFLEAYYEFLENKQGSENNDLIKKAKEIRNITDVDLSIDEFENQFYNSYASLLPKEVSVDKSFLIKNVLPLYLAKGAEKSFKLLFRLLFNDEVEILQPKNDIIRASDGKWIIDNVLKVEKNLRSVYTGNGTTKIFYLIPCRCPVRNVSLPIRGSLYVDGVLQTNGFTIFQETKKLVFVTAPANNSKIEFYYNNPDISILNNRKVTGLSSGASAIVERAVPRVITDQLNFGLPFEFFISNNTLTGNFINGEKIISDVINSKNIKIDLEIDTFSVLTRIDIINQGLNYNVGDPVFVVGGTTVTPATAQIDRVGSGFNSRIIVNYGGAGFKSASLLFGSNTPNTTVFTGAIDGVNTNHFTANSYTVFGTDSISNFLNVSIGAADYGFSGPYTENVTTRLIDAFSSIKVTGLGPITNAVILFSNVLSNTTSIDSEGAKYFASNTFYDIKDFNSIGRIDVYSGGSGYKVGDEVIFDSNPLGTVGFGAAAAVKQVKSNGVISLIEIQPERISGTANVLNNTVQIVGTGTNFTNDLRVGDKIVIRSQERFINAITSSTTANVNVAFSWQDGTTWANNYKIGSFALGPVGGINYSQGNFPNVTVSNTASGGVNANIAITSLMGNGEQLQAITDIQKGAVLSILINTVGSGYDYIPQIDLTGYGDGKAKANAIIGDSYVVLPGRWTTSDSILSSSYRKIQGKDYYVDYSYVTSSLIEFKRYKKIIKELLHPAGFVNYANFNISDNTKITIQTNFTSSNTISGTVSVVNNSIYIVGSGTKFNIANAKGSLTIGSNIAVNGVIKTVSSIISNTNLSVTTAFTSNANAQTLVILT